MPDPYTLVENWKDNVKLLCDITWADIYNYLINMASLYTNENLKAYKSLEAYNFIVSGHVHDVAYHGTNNLSEFCFIKTKVIIKAFSFFTSENIFSFFEIFSFCTSENIFRFFEMFCFSASKLCYNYLGSNIFCVYSYLFLHSIRTIC